jgi:hypothetical protein
MAVVASFVVIDPVQAQGVQTASTKTQAVQEQHGRAEALARDPLALDAKDLLSSQLWGLSQEEMTRVKALQQGPRAAFSVPNLSPIEVLGIHARNDAERRKYAEMLARIVEDDVKRTLVFQQAFQDAMLRLFGVQPVVSFDGLPRARAPVGAADAAHVPRSLVDDPAPSAQTSGKPR